MCWFIYFHVVLQKDTPNSRLKIAPVPEKGYSSYVGAFPDFSMPKGICGCGWVRDNGGGIIDIAIATIRHFVAQPPVKRVDAWWAWGGVEKAARPQKEEAITAEDCVSRNAKSELAPDICYRITEPAKFRHDPP